MINIRRGVFETNSSSTHSIVMMKNPEAQFPDNWYQLSEDGGLILFEDDLDFGWGPDILNDSFGRLCYAIASYGDKKEKMDEICELCKKHIPGFKSFCFMNDGYGRRSQYHGSIDHQSVGTLDGFLKSADVSLEDFIFNNRYLVIIDHDNHVSLFDTLYNRHLINTDEITCVYPQP